jgi:hypothetical protein
VNRRTLIFPLSGNKIDALPVHCVPNAAHRNEGEAEMSDKEKSTDPGLTALGGVDTYRIHKMIAARVTTAR